MTDTRQLGKGMIVAGWLCVLAVLVVVFNEIDDRQRNPNREVASRIDTDTAVVVLQRNRQGHYLATGGINGRSVEFLLDTGATTISVPAGLADDIGLEQGIETRVGTAAGPVTVYATRLDRVELGDIRIRGVRAHINPHARGKEVLLGMSFLRQLDFRQEGDRLILEQRVVLP